MRLYRQKRATLGQQGRFHSFVGSVSHWGENGAYWGGQAAYSLFTIWERMGRQTHQSYQCETYAFFFLLGSEFLGRTERSELSSSQLVKKPGGEVRRGGGGGLPLPAVPLQVFFHKTCPAKGRTSPLEREPLESAQIAGQSIQKSAGNFYAASGGKNGRKEKSGVSYLG